jgi:hypothetical protein
MPRNGRLDPEPASDLLGLRPALFAAGRGAVTFSHFRYRALG